VVGTTNVFGQEMPLRRFMGIPPVGATTGDHEQMSLLAGESAGLIADVRPAGELVRAIAAQAEQVLSALR
jgi:enoyl-[acyl-carrier protein] reductase II